MIIYYEYRGVAQLVAYLTGGQGVASSSLVTPTKNPYTIVCGFLLITYSLFLKFDLFEDFLRVTSNSKQEKSLNESKKRQVITCRFRFIVT